MARPQAGQCLGVGQNGHSDSLNGAFILLLNRKQMEQRIYMRLGPRLVTVATMRHTQSLGISPSQRKESAGQSSTELWAHSLPFVPLQT